MNTKFITTVGIFMSLWLIPPMSPLHSRTAKHVAAKRGRREQKPVVPPVGVPVLLTAHAGVAASRATTAKHATWCACQHHAVPKQSTKEASI